jgi:hypothetical protein
MAGAEDNLTAIVVDFGQRSYAESQAARLPAGAVGQLTEGIACQVGELEVMSAIVARNEAVAAEVRFDERSGGDAIEIASGRRGAPMASSRG